MKCYRAGCKEGGHSNFGECIRAARITIGPTGTNSKTILSELEAYRSARAQGVQPASTKRRDTEAAMAISDHTGTAFDAGAD